MQDVSIIQSLGAVLFALAVLHTFSAKYFERLSTRYPSHAGIFHLLGEVEVVFGFWALILILSIFFIDSKDAAVAYIEARNFTEPMFVFAIMVVAASRPVLQFASTLVQALSRPLPLPGMLPNYVVILGVVPLMGSLITEPAAMTLGAFMLAGDLFSQPIGKRLQYTTLGVLFVNISIGGTLTSFAAPPVLMVAGTWNWDSAYMLSHFGWKAALAVGANTLLFSFIFAKELSKLPKPQVRQSGKNAPAFLIVVHLLFLFGIVFFSHHAAVFMALFLFFLGIVHAYEEYQDRLILREGLLVAFFLAGLVTLGGQQQWWLEPLLLSMSDNVIFVGATALTAITDNAALTYLGSLVPGLSESFKYALVAGAVTGGGLTIIANAPNPAGISILSPHFESKAINPLGLLAGALIPTAVAAAAFLLL